ncbi:hypothetical protein DM292_17540 [Stutzerimonas frequens]|uniref:SphA family protein n=1 Tax=Stutzerimonas frequens TaxID=2968969 RepID=UPI000D7E95B4|nr:transporter [Stutzerimonas frequens]AWT12750.1 hypothetical protein DM292_17540 [Stutzerimonas frequens]
MKKRDFRAGGGVSLAVAVSLACAGSLAQASESNGSQYPVGVDTNLSGLMLPEGLNMLLYYSRYTADTITDDHGDSRAAVADYDVEANVVATRFSYVWPGVKWLGANVETRLVLVVPTIDLTLDINRPGGLPPLDRGGSTTALGDTTFAPVLLGWHSKTLHQIAGVETFLPTGEYDVNEPVNAGRNYYQVAPFYAATWFPNPRWEASAKLRYGMNTTNADTDYRSGDELTLEFSGGYRLTERLSAGINGYWFEQTTDDEIDNRTVAEGNQGSVKAIGPYVSYRFASNFALIAKWQEEFDAENRPEGTRLWLQARLPF